MRRKLCGGYLLPLHSNLFCSLYLFMEVLSLRLRWKRTTLQADSPDRLEFPLAFQILHYFFNAHPSGCSSHIKPPVKEKGRHESES